VRGGSTQRVAAWCALRAALPVPAAAFRSAACCALFTLPARSPAIRRPKGETRRRSAHQKSTKKARHWHAM